MSIYENLLFLHGHLVDATASETRTASTAPAARTDAPARARRPAESQPRAPLLQPRRRVQGAAALRGMGDCG